MAEEHTNVENVLFAPLTVKSIIVGVMALVNKRGNFTENDVHLAFGDLEIIGEASTPGQALGLCVQLQLVIANQGPLTATMVMLTDPLPPCLTFGSATSSQGSCTLAGGNTITCALGDLYNGAVATVTMHLTPTMGGLVANTVTVAGIKPDLDMQNNSATVSTMVTGQVFLPLITK